MKNKFINSDKLIVCFQSADKKIVNINKKENWITFVGKLNKSKGYDIFGSAIIKILDKYPKWKSSCEQCMRCVNMCPQEAIFQTYGGITKGKNRYGT